MAAAALVPAGIAAHAARSLARTLARSLALAAALGAGVAQLAHAAEIGIMPVAILLDKSVTRTTVSLVNNGRDAVTMQAETVTWGRLPGESDKPTDALVVNPLIFTIAPGQTQIVRIGMRGTPDPVKEVTYRLVLRELPTAVTPETDNATRVRVLMAMRVPVYVAPMEAVRKEEWKMSSDAKGNPVVQVRNAGNVHYRVGKINLRQEGVRDGPALASATESALLFPGEQRSITLLPEAAAVGGAKSIKGTVMLEAFTDRGVQYMALDARSD